MMELMLKGTALAVTALLCGGLVRRGAPEFSLILILASGAGILLLAAETLGQLIERMEQLARLAQLDGEILEPVLKTTALSVLTKITAELCRSGGEGGLAAFVETAGTIFALWTALPLAEGVLALMGQLLT